MSSKSKTTATKEDDKPALVPKLRFPEFQDTEGWHQKSLGSLGRLTRGLTYSSADVASDGLLVLRSTNIQDGHLVLDRDLVFVGKPCPDTLRLEEGDIVICMSNGSKALVGKSGEYSGDYAGDITVGAFCSFFRPAFPYAKLAFQLDSYQRYIADLVAGGNINNLTNSVLEEFNLPVPSIPPEQQKIAECLSSVDELIAAQARKLDALQIHKKGLMQQLFPRAGETQPRLRFPEFQNAGEWEIRFVSQLAKVTTGAKDTQNKVEGGRYPFFVRSQAVERIDSYSYDGEAVLTSGDGVGVGKNFHYINGKFDFHQRVYCIYDFDESVSGLFFYLYFSEHFGERVMRMSAKNSVDSVRMAMITEMPVTMPSLPEQQRIAACLTTLDDLIAAQTQKLEALKTHKQGLMQQLFPSPEEVEA